MKGVKNVVSARGQWKNGLRNKVEANMFPQVEFYRKFLLSDSETE